MSQSYNYSEYSEFNRFQNLDSLEWKIIEHFLDSDTKYARLFWKLLKDNTMNAPLIDDSEITDPDLATRRKKRLPMVDQGNNHDNENVRVFLSPFIDDAYTKECSLVRIFVENIYPTNHMQSAVEITVETITHNKISVVYPEAQEDTESVANPNDFTTDGDLLVKRKNRATLLLKCVIAELNGLYLDGIGYLQLNAQGGLPGKVEMPLYNNRSFYGHATTFVLHIGNDAGELTEDDPFNAL